MKAWLDQRDLDAGADWNEQVASAIRGADAVVFLIGPPGPDDRFQNFEWQQVVDGEAYLDPSKALVPIIIGGAEMPGFLRGRKPIVVSTGSMDVQTLADAIADAIRKPSDTVDPRATRARPQGARTGFAEPARIFAATPLNKRPKERLCGL